MQKEISLLENEVYRLLYVIYFSRYDYCAKQCAGLTSRLDKCSLLYKIYYPVWQQGDFNQIEASKLIQLGLKYTLRKQKFHWRKLAVDMSVFDGPESKFEKTINWAITDVPSRSDMDMIGAADKFYKSMTVREYNENYTIHKNIIRFLEWYLRGWVMKWYKLFLPYRLLIVIEWNTSYRAGSDGQLISMYIWKTQEKLNIVAEWDKTQNEYTAGYKVDFDLVLDIKRAG